MSRKLDQLEALRGAAAVYVLAHHLIKGRLSYGSGLVDGLFSFGQEAVILFFIISGFVIYYSTCSRPNKTFSGYFFRRWIRIYPIFLLSLAVSLFLVHSGSQSLSGLWRSLLGNLFMLQDCSSLKPGVLVDTFCGNSPLWSLSYEWWFYMMFFPIFRYVPEKHQRWVAGVISIIGLVTYVVSPNQISRFGVYFAIWWAGVELARTYVSGIRPALGNQKFSLVILSFLSLSFACVVIWQLRFGQKLVWGIHPVLEARHFFAAILLIVIGLIWARMDWMFFNKTLEAFRLVAPISYGLYILHYPIAVAGNWVEIVPGKAAQTLLGVAVAFVGAWFAEVPFQGFVKRVLQRAFVSLHDPPSAKRVCVNDVSP